MPVIKLIILESSFWGSRPNRCSSRTEGWCECVSNRPEDQTKDEKLWTDQETFLAYQCQDQVMPQTDETTTGHGQTRSASKLTDSSISIIVIIISRDMYSLSICFHTGELTTLDQVAGGHTSQENTRRFACSKWILVSIISMQPDSCGMSE